MVKQGKPTLYDAAFEHDSCGFGLVAHVGGKASAALVDTAFSALAKLSHRGGVNADGVSGTSITSARRTASRNSSPCNPAGESTTRQS